MWRESMSCPSVRPPLGKTLHCFENDANFWIQEFLVVNLKRLYRFFFFFNHSSTPLLWTHTRIHKKRDWVMNLLSAWNAFSSGHMDSFVGRRESKQIAGCWHPKPTQREIISLQITMSYKNRETLLAAASEGDIAIKISVNPKERGESQFSSDWHRLKC